MVWEWVHCVSHFRPPLQPLLSRSLLDIVNDVNAEISFSFCVGLVQAVSWVKKPQMCMGTEHRHCLPLPSDTGSYPQAVGCSCRLPSCGAQPTAVEVGKPHFLLSANPSWQQRPLDPPHQMEPTQ